MRIDWTRLLQPFPGRSIDERLDAALAGKTFARLACEMGIKEASLKSRFYRQRIYRGVNLKCHVVYAKERPNYAKRMGAAIKAFACSERMTEEEYRELIRTEDGERRFLKCCQLINLPVFRCQYRSSGAKG